MSGRRWSLLDLVTLATLGISSGVLFAGWGILWSSLSPLFAAVLPLQYLLFAGTWVIAGPLAGSIIRRPGAALAGEMIAASVSFLLASQWSIDAIASGAAQGIGAEVAFALISYRRPHIGIVVLAGDETPTDSVTAAPLELGLGDGPGIASCLPVSADILRDMSPALLGTATAVDGEKVTLAIDHWYAGDTGATEIGRAHV